MRNYFSIWSSIKVLVLWRIKWVRFITDRIDIIFFVAGLLRAFRLFSQPVSCFFGLCLWKLRLTKPIIRLIWRIIRQWRFYLSKRRIKMPMLIWILLCILIFLRFSEFYFRFYLSLLKFRLLWIILIRWGDWWWTDCTFFHMLFFIAFYSLFNLIIQLLRTEPFLLIVWQCIKCNVNQKLLNVFL